MDDLVKIISDAGLGTGSLIALVIVIWQQLKIIKSFQYAIEKNTTATTLLTEKIQQTIETERETKSVIEKCKVTQLALKQAQNANS